MFRLPVFLLVHDFPLVVSLESCLCMVFRFLVVVVNFYYHVRYNTGLKLMVRDVT